MGQQQLLLIVIGVIIVGIAVTGGILYFRSHAIDSKRDLVITECENIANLAHKHFMRPREYGGGGRITFIDFEMPDQLKTTASGNYSATAYRDSVVILGTGNDVVNGNDSIKVKTIVLSDRHYSVIIN